MPANYEIRDRTGRLLRTVPAVLDPVELSGVSTVSGSNLLTVTSTTGVYPGMAVFCANVPRGAFVHAVRSATELELYASAFNATTGIWTTGAANAQATANAAGLKAHAQGFNPVPVTQWYAEGCWRNLHYTSSHGGPPASFGATLTDGAAAFGIHGYGPGVAVVPTAGTVASSTFGQTAVEIIKSDELAAIPVKRHEGVPLAVWLLVSTGGHQTCHTIGRGDSCGYAGATS